MKRTRYAQVGLGGRARSFYEWIASDYTDSAELVGFCDLNQTRMNYANRVLQEQFSYAPVPTYRADAFDRMVAECKPDVVIVTSIGPHPPPLHRPRPWSSAATPSPRSR